MSNGRPERAEKAALYELGFEILPFRELPREYQLAMAWYMAIDGEAWDDVIDWDKHVLSEDSSLMTEAERSAFFKEVLSAYLDKFCLRYGDIEFGMAIWPTRNIIESIYGDENKPGSGNSLEAIFAYYSGPITGYHTTEYSEDGRWPVVMSSFEDETLQDGWHRMKIYASNGHSTIPVIFYPDEWHHELIAAKRNNAIR